MAKARSSAFDQSDAIRKEFDGASDRAAAVVAGAYLDEILRELLTAFFVESPEGEPKLYESGGPLGTFSAKIEVAFRVGLLSLYERRVLHAIRGIRNQFAHELGDVAFSDQSIRDRCKNIETPFSLVAPTEIELQQAGQPEPPAPTIEKADSNNPRAIFQEAVQTMVHCLAGRFADAGAAARSTPADFVYAHEPALRQHDRIKALLAEKEELIGALPIGHPMRASDVEAAKRDRLLVRLNDYILKMLKAAHNQP